MADLLSGGHKFYASFNPLYARVSKKGQNLNRDLLTHHILNIEMELYGTLKGNITLKISDFIFMLFSYLFEIVKDLCLRLLLFRRFPFFNDGFIFRKPVEITLWSSLK